MAGKSVGFILGAVWGLAGSVLLMILLGWIDYEVELLEGLPYPLVFTLGLPSALWWLVIHQVFETFSISSLVGIILVSIPSILIGGGIGHGIDKLIRGKSSNR